MSALLPPDSSLQDQPAAGTGTETLVKGVALDQEGLARSLLHTASDGIHVLDRAGFLREMSDSFCSVLGYTRPELLGRHVSEWDAQWSRAELEQRLERLIEQDESIFETRHRCKSGQIMDVEVHIRSFVLDGERLLFCSARDISSRKASEELIRLQAGALNNSINGIAISDASLPDMPLIYVNPAFERITGYSSAEALGRNCRFLQRDDRQQADLERMRTALRRGEAVKVTLRNYRKDGSLFWNRFQIAPIRAPEGKVSHFVAVINDITDRKASDDYMRLVSQVFLYADESIFITDAEGNIVEVNPAFTRTTGYQREEVLGKNPSLLQSGRHDNQFFSDMWQSLLERGHWSGEIWNRRKNGDIYPDKLTISVVRSEEGDTLSYVCISSDISLIKAQQSKLELLALHDPLTGLPNRALLNDRLAMALAEARRFGGRMAVCFIDLDNFKPVNDQYGHEVGDRLLIDVGRRLTSTLRATDTVARLGGDEFILILSELDSEQQFVNTLTRVMDGLSKPFTLDEKLIGISASVGVTVFPDDDADAETLLRHADQAMYLAKEGGRNRFHFFNVADDREAHLRSEGRHRVSYALERSELELHYQPKVNLRTGRVFGMEALIRWRHPVQGLLAPGAFLPLAENSELENEISEWVLRQALKQLAQWQEQGMDLVVSVNLPARHLHSEQFISFITQLLAEYPRLTPQRLELEVLESVALWDIPSVIRTMTHCRSLGLLFSIDDFGTGYASLAYLRRLPVDTIKIDQSFIRDMLNDPEDLSIVEAVISLATAFQKNLVAEGMETPDHGSILLYLGCEQAQGYGIAKPMPAEQVSDWVIHYRPNPQWINIGPKCLRREDIALAFAEVWHRRWVDQVIQSLENESALAVPLDSNACTFGEWLNHTGRQRYRDIPELEEIDALHDAVHVRARNLRQQAELGAVGDLAAGISQLLELRDQLISMLRRLIAHL